MAYLRRLRFALVIALLGVVPLGAAPKWLKLQTNDVVIYSDAAPKDVVEFAVGYTAFRHAFRDMFAPPHDPPRATVLLFRELATLQQKLPKATREGYQNISFSTDVDGVALLALAVDGDRDSALQQTIQFDTIWSLQRSGYVLPIWMSQGAGEVLESLTVKRGKCLIGDRSGVYRDNWLGATPIAWSRFFEIDTYSPEYAGRDAHGIFHAQAWALMHRVLLGSENPGAAFSDLAAKVQLGEEGAALERLLGAPTAQWNDVLAKHVRARGGLRELTFDDAAVRAHLAPTAAPELEVHLVLSDLLFAATHSDEGELELAAAQRLAPGDVLVKEARARQGYRGSSTDGSLYAREAIELGSKNPMVYLRSAEERLGKGGSRGDEAGGGGLAAEEALAEIRTALKLDPDRTLAYQLLGRALFLAPNLPPVEAIGELSRGVCRGREGERVRYYRGLLWLRLNRPELFQADMKQIISDPLSDSDIRKIAALQFGRAEVDVVQRKVDQLAKEGRYAEAIETTDAAILKVTLTTSREALKRLRAWVEERRALDEIQAAVDAGDAAAVVAKGEAFEKQYPASRALSVVRRAVNSARSPAQAHSAPAAAP